MVRSLSFELQGSVQLFLSYKEVHSLKVVAVAPLGAIVTGHLAAVATLCHLVPPGNPRDGCASISGPSKVVPSQWGQWGEVTEREKEGVGQCEELLVVPGRLIATPRSIVR